MGSFYKPFICKHLHKTVLNLDRANWLDRVLNGFDAVLRKKYPKNFRNLTSKWLNFSKNPRNFSGNPKGFSIRFWGRKFFTTKVAMITKSRRRLFSFVTIVVFVVKRIPLRHPDLPQQSVLTGPL
jgi:hypothetical protein